MPADIKTTLKKYSFGVLEILAVVWGLERLRFQLYGKSVQLNSFNQALEPLVKSNKANEQYSAQLTRCLDRLSLFELSSKYTSCEEINLINFIGRKPTEHATPVDNYQKENVINTIARLAEITSVQG